MFSRDSLCTVIIWFSCMTKRAVTVITLVILLAASACATKEMKAATAVHVSWDAAVALIRDGSIKYVWQTHTLDVSLETENGIEYVTREPRIDAVWHLVREIDPNGKKIHFITE